MGYVIAAYTIVIGSLVAYALRVEIQRRALIRQAEEDRASGDDGARGAGGG